MDESKMRGWPLQFFNACKDDCIVPDRIIETQEGSILFSWIRLGKYAEIEFCDNNYIIAWTCYEGDNEPEEIFNDQIESNEFGGRLRVLLNVIEDFLA